MDMLMEGYEQIQKLEDKVELLEMDVWRLGQQIMDIETTKEKFYRGEVVERAKLDAYFKKWYEEATIEKIENE